MSKVANQLSDAWKAVQAAGIPDHLHEVAFREALVLADPQSDLTGRSSSSKAADAKTEKPRRSPDSTPQTKQGAAPKQTSTKIYTHSFDGNEDDFFKKFAEECGVEEESLRRVFIFTDGTWRISLSRSKLGATEAERNRSVGLLLAASRFYVNGTVATPISDVREAASRIPYEVSRNFGKHMEGVEGTLPGGSGRDKAIRVQTGKIDDPFKATIKRVLGESDG